MAKANPSPSNDPPDQPRDYLVTGLLSLAIATSLGGFAWLFAMWWTSGPADAFEVLRIASREYVAGHPRVAGELAETVTLPPLRTIDEFDPSGEGKPSEWTKENISERVTPTDPHASWRCLQDFLIGAGRVARSRYEADRRERRRQWRDALPPLERSAEKGFPKGRTADGNRMLGEIYFRLGRFDDASPRLRRAIEADQTLAVSLLPVAAEADLRAIQVKPQVALDSIETFLALPALKPPELFRGMRIRLEALIELGRHDDVKSGVADAIRVAAEQPIEFRRDAAEFADEAKLLGAASMVRQAIRRHGANPVDPTDQNPLAAKRLAPAVRILRRLQHDSYPRVATLARLWDARASLVMGNRDDALVELTVVRQQRPFGALSILGGLEELELLAREGRGVEMLQTTNYLIDEIRTPEGFFADLISFDQFRDRLIAAIATLRARGDFPHAIDAARSLPPVFDVSDALIQEAAGYASWAAAIRREGTDVQGVVDRSTSVVSRAKYRAAGDAYAEAAKHLFDTEDYLTAQWSAIEAYQQGRHFSRSLMLLKSYLRYEDRRRMPRGLLALGRGTLAEGDIDAATQALRRCIAEYPRDPLRYDARLMLAKAHAERREIDEARKQLLDNLQDGALTPQSPAWRESLFTLGEVLYRHAYQRLLAIDEKDTRTRDEIHKATAPMLREATDYLNESVRRYWPTPRAESAAYLAGRAHVLAAQWPRIESRSPEILEAARRSLRAQADQELQLALDGFVRVRRRLLEREEEVRLTPSQRAILRNCLMSEADVLQQMGRLDEAATAFRAVELRYLNEPLSLEAILGRAACNRAMGRVFESNQLIRQAKLVLDRIPPEFNDEFDTLTRFDREGWDNYLGWKTGRLATAGA